MTEHEKRLVCCSSTCPDFSGRCTETEPGLLSRGKLRTGGGVGASGAQRINVRMKKCSI